MFYYVSKLVSLLIWPSNVISILLLAGTILVLTGRGGRFFQHWSRRILVAGIALFFICGFGPVGTWLIIPLEQRFPLGPLPEKIAGVIMLGGFESPVITHARKQLSLNEGAERLTEGVRIAMLRPQARVIFTGGEARLFGSGEGESATGAVGSYLADIGISPARIVLEGKSRTTWENAIFIAEMLKPQPGERYVLVTSGYHMPRSVGTFRQAGFDVVPWPVDFRTTGNDAFRIMASSAPAGLERLDLAFKEWVGLIAYRLSGRSNALWPGPEPGLPAPQVRPIPSASPLPGR